LKNIISFKIYFKFYVIYIVVGSQPYTYILFLVHIDLVFVLFVVVPCVGGNM